MRKFLVYVLTPSLLGLLVLIKIPEIEEWLKRQSSYSGLIIGIGIAVCTIIVHLVNVVAPLKKYERIERNKWNMIEMMFSLFQDNYFSKNQLAANVMVTKRYFINKRECKKNNIDQTVRKFFQKVFKVVWSYDGNTIDKRLVFTVNQGVSGEAYRKGRPVIADMQEVDIREFNLNTDQIDALKNLEFIICCPIFAIDERYDKLSDKVIGILNVSSSNSDSRHLIANNEDRKHLTEQMMRFSKICSLII